jgi:iron-sulfur cluster repair protein YtfE (RIC family)
LHEHHHNEESIAFPFVAKRSPLPEKVTLDHKSLVAQLDACAALVATVVSGTAGDIKATLAELESQFGILRTSTEAHLLEEEETALPLARHHFTRAEWKKGVEEIILKSQCAQSPRRYPWLIYPVPSLVQTPSPKTSAGCCDRSPR